MFYGLSRNLPPVWFPHSRWSHHGGWHRTRSSIFHPRPLGLPLSPSRALPLSPTPPWHGCHASPSPALRGPPRAATVSSARELRGSSFPEGWIHLGLEERELAKQRRGRSFSTQREQHVKRHRGAASPPTHTTWTASRLQLLSLPDPPACGSPTILHFQETPRPGPSCVSDHP